MVTHDESMPDLADRIYKMEDGRLVENERFSLYQSGGRRLENIRDLPAQIRIRYRTGGRNP